MDFQRAINLAREHLRAGRLAEARELCRQIVTVDPRCAGALHILGIVAHRAGDSAAGLELIGRAISANPGVFFYHADLGLIHASRREFHEAIVAFRKALALHPNLPEMQYDLGLALKETGQLDEAIPLLARAAAMRPGVAAHHFQLGQALAAKGRASEAIAALRVSVQLRPDFPEALINLGGLLSDQGQLDEAHAFLQRAANLRPDMAEAHINLSTALGRKGHLDDSISALRKALALRPDSVDARWNLGLALLLKGDFVEGFPAYEARLKLGGGFANPFNFGQPMWDGAQLAGRQILLYAEQGFGDTIHFIRYIPQVIARGGNVVLACQPELRNLLSNTPGIERLVTIGSEPFGPFDVHCPLMSLPAIFHTTLDTIPAPIPYIFPDTPRVEHWRPKLSLDRDRFHVGLVWSGRSLPRGRSIPLADLALLVAAPGVRFHSLQTGEAAAQAAQPPAGMDLIDWSSHIQDFSDTASLLSHMDLLITIDTAAAHLAGAMGRPVWTLLQYVPDWRWQLARPDSPWYPTMRLFRQLRLNDWQTPIARAAAELMKLSQS